MMPFRIVSRRVRALSIAACCALLPVAAQAAATVCPSPLTRAIPARSSISPTGSAVVQQVGEAAGQQRDAAFLTEILAGNLPTFLRELVPVTLTGTLASGRKVLVTLCVTPEYMAVGSDSDFVRVPLGLAAAARIAKEFGFLLPTTKMVDAIYQQADKRVSPSPMKPTAKMTTTSYLVEHNRTVERQLAATGTSHATLSAGHKKDLVLSNRLRAKSGRVAIYGWHRPNGKPIQPLSTVHGAEYADYSHGIRLVSQTAYVDGKPTKLDDIMRDRELAGIVSNEGPIADVTLLIAEVARPATN